MSYLFPYTLPEAERNKVLAKRAADEPKLDILRQQLKEIERTDGVGEVWLAADTAVREQCVNSVFGGEVDVDAVKKIEYILENLRRGVRKQAEKKARLDQGLPPLHDPEEEEMLRKEAERKKEVADSFRKHNEDIEASEAYYKELLNGRDELPAEELTVEVAMKLCGYPWEADDPLSGSALDTISEDGQLDEALWDGMTEEERYDHAISVLKAFAIDDDELGDLDILGINEKDEPVIQSGSMLPSAHEAPSVLLEDDTKTLTPEDDASTIASDEDSDYKDSDDENDSKLDTGSQVSLISDDAKTLVADDRSIASKSSITTKTFPVPKHGSRAKLANKHIPPPPGSGGIIRNMRGTDLFKFGSCNLDPLTETYQPEFYLDYLSTWPDCCFVVENPDGGIDAYLLGKIESSPFYSTPTPYDPNTNTNENYLPWHAHITALTVASHARQSGWGTKLSQRFEEVADQYNCWFVDLFVRSENKIAITLYRKLGYTVFKRVVDYYADGEDAFDMRKPLSRDEDRKHIRENGEDIHVDPENVW